MPALHKYHISFSPSNRSIDILPGTSLLEAAWMAGIRVSSACGGNGKCFKCRIMIREGKTSPLTPRELNSLPEKDIADGYRLACCAYALSDLDIDVPEKSVVDNATLHFYGLTEHKGLDPVIESHEIIGLVPRGASPLGIAIDLGTTKIAAWLINLVTGRELSEYGGLNPQMQFGDDVMTRLHCAISDGPACRLTATVRTAIRDIISGLVKDAGGSLDQVSDICIVGNTAMTHLLLDLPVSQLAASPYVAATNSALDVKARDLDLIACPGAYVHVLPGIGGFVGADHVAMIMSSNIDHSEMITLGLDIGTNTEIVINRPDRGRMISTSCPSGPAFEGAHVTDGMKAMKGAIESVRLTEKGAEIRTIGDAPAIGLCGSGIIDAIAELCRWGIINERGRLLKTDKRVYNGKEGPEFYLVEGMQGEGRVVITQKDIENIQLAKGAIRAGIAALMEVTEVSPEEVKEVVLAGAFGTYINISNAIEMGLLPYFPDASYKQVGNAAGHGAKMALMSKEERSRAREIAENTGYLELTTHRGFKRLFAEGMIFRGKDRRWDVEH